MLGIKCLNHKAYQDQQSKHIKQLTVTENKKRNLGCSERTTLRKIFEPLGGSQMGQYMQ